MNEIECETCIKRKTKYCPTSIDCMATDDMPYYQNRIMLLEENQQLKEQLEQRDNIINKAREYIKNNADIYTNIIGKEVGFFKTHDDGWTPIELLEILDNKGE